ncbi:conserved hypothetical protein [Agrobacterium tumefaciens str. Kerr 14]|uniref:Uncharacterized protein n=1 Tax=Agrobacterium tumefaciens str. Kerr 14 TaxID=1183424 RepID=A0A1S7P9U5_AGRTU|nr:conserved hypothetical protein [Agrobacterium tumefaciens str. Kerr 14]
MTAWRRDQMGGIMSPVSAPTMPALSRSERGADIVQLHREVGIALVPADVSFHAAPNTAAHKGE